MLCISYVTKDFSDFSYQRGPLDIINQIIVWKKWPKYFYNNAHPNSAPQAQKWIIDPFPMHFAHWYLKIT